MLSKTNNVTHTNDIYLLNQENQDYDNQHDQQLMPCKHDGGRGHQNRSNPQSIAHKHNDGVKRFTTELEPNNVLEEKEEWLYWWADNYGAWNNNPYTPTKGNEIRSSHIFNVATSDFNLTKTKQKSKQELWMKYLCQISWNQASSEVQIPSTEKWPS